MKIEDLETTACSSQMQDRPAHLPSLQTPTRPVRTSVMLTGVLPAARVGPADVATSLPHVSVHAPSRVQALSNRNRMCYSAWPPSMERTRDSGCPSAPPSQLPETSNRSHLCAVRSCPLKAAVSLLFVKCTEEAPSRCVPKHSGQWMKGRLVSGGPEPPTSSRPAPVHLSVPAAFPGTGTMCSFPFCPVSQAVKEPSEHFHFPPHAGCPQPECVHEILATSPQKTANRSVCDSG